MTSVHELLLLAAKPDASLEALRWTEHACARVGLEARRAQQLATAVVEAVNNSLEHAYNCVPGDVRLVLLASDDRIVVTVSDDGCGLPPTMRAAAPPPAATRGRGRWIMQQSCDEIRHVIASDQQTVVLVKHRPQSRAISLGDFK
jgi:anti-sigma regulatory factor (Ser/Thr protein kinase)